MIKVPDIQPAQIEQSKKRIAAYQNLLRKREEKENQKAKQAQLRAFKKAEAAAKEAARIAILKAQEEEEQRRLEKLAAEAEKEEEFYDCEEPYDLQLYDPDLHFENQAEKIESICRTLTPTPEEGPAKQTNIVEKVPVSKPVEESPIKEPIDI